MTANTYALLADLVLVVGIIAAIIAAYCAYTLVRHYSDLDARLDDVMDEWETYAEAERCRRAEGTSPLAFYGVRWLIERWLFMRKHDIVWALVGARHKRDIAERQFEAQQQAHDAWTEGVIEDRRTF